MAPAPEAAPAPKTPSSDSDSNSETPSDDYSSSPPPPPSASPPPPPVSRPPPPPPKIYSPPPPSTPNKELHPLPPINNPSTRNLPPNIRQNMAKLGKVLAVNSLKKAGSGQGETRVFKQRKLVGHPRIIHRDIKSANILLDNDFEAKVLWLQSKMLQEIGKRSDKSDFSLIRGMLFEYCGRAQWPGRALDKDTKHGRRETTVSLLPYVLKSRAEGLCTCIRTDGRWATSFKYGFILEMLSATSVRHSATEGTITLH
ncbi:proline-rich receptor-like protein kinase PERK9 [Tanacetum coccineum]